MTWLAIINWFLVSLFGVFYNISYIDEAKYLIKGWLMTTGQIGYYSTPNFFYQHMPGGLLWFGLGQKIFGPNLLVGRLQAVIIGWLILYLTYVLAKNLAGKTAAKLSVLILSLAVGAELYYSSAITHGLAAAILLLAFISTSRKKYLWSSFWFALAFIVRENFLFTLIIYLVFLVWQLKISKALLKNMTVILLILVIFFAPGWPGILKILNNFPGVSWLLPIDLAQKIVLGLNWQKQNYDLFLYWVAIREFGVIYFSFLICLLTGIVAMIKLKLAANLKPVWLLLLTIACFNFLAHTWSAFQLTPRAIVSYLPYFAPLMAVIGGVALNRSPKSLLKAYPVLLTLALFTNRYSSIAGHFNQPTHLQQINQSIQPLKEITADKNKIVWLSEPIALYLAGKISYYPLINHTNFFKPSEDTVTVRSLGFWNQEMMSQWLNQADLVVMDSNRLLILSRNSLTRPTAEMITERLQTQFILLKIDHYIWPGNLNFYLPRNKF